MILLLSEISLLPYQAQAQTVYLAENSSHTIQDSNIKFICNYTGSSRDINYNSCMESLANYVENSSENDTILYNPPVSEKQC